MPIPSFSVSQEHLQKVLPMLLTVLITILLGQESAQFVWQLVPSPPQTAPSVVTSSSDKTPRASANDKLDLQPLLSANLFGQFTENKQQPEQTVVTDAPETNLRLKLRGIFAMENPSESRALIESANGEAQPYALGMAVAGGAELHAIYVDRVLLKRGGRLETLRLERDTPSAASANNTTYRSSQTSGAPRVIDSSTAAKLSSIRSELLNDPTKASQYLRLQPARSNGQMKGYRIYPGRKRELFKEAGLRPGDIVTAVNGVSLDDPSRSLQLLGDLSSAQQINLQIERGGQTQSLSVNLN